MTKLEKSAETVVNQCMGIKKGELILIVYNESTQEIADALFKASSGKTEAVAVKMQPTGEHGTEPSKLIAKLMKQADVILAPTEFSLSHTKARRDATKKGVRIASMPGITRSMFERTLDIDYKEMEAVLKILEKKFQKTSKVTIKSVSGTDIILGVKGRGRTLDTGIYTKKGEWGNLPAGEICLAPKEADGVYVIDAMEDICNPKTKVFVKKGKVQEIEGDDKFRKRIFAIKNARNIAELGIGTNPKATISGNILEDEKVLGTIHIAVGDNTSYDGGRIKSEIHWDGIVIAPDVWFDDEKIMSKGELLL